MSKKSIIIYLAMIVLFSVPSCTPTYIGQRMQGLECINIENSGHIYDDSQGIIFDYAAFIDHNSNKINISGTLMIKDDVFTGAWDIDNIDLYFYFMDNNEVILKREHLFVYTSGEFADAKINFSGDFDYGADYVYVAHGFKVRVSL